MEAQALDSDLPSPIMDDSSSAPPSISNYVEDWEDELEEFTGPPKDSIKGWDELRSQIEVTLKQDLKTLSINHVNQYMILMNFANLRLKGYKRGEVSNNNFTFELCLPNESL
jgi:hypothetical protein